MSTLREVVRKHLKKVETGGFPEALEAAKVIRPLLPKGNPHRGKKCMTPDEVVEWYAGEFIDIVDSGSWFAMNSLLNCLDKFVPGGP